MTWNGQFCPIHNFFQSFRTEMAQNDSEWPISPDSQLFQSIPTKVAQNDSQWPILPDSQLFQSIPSKVAQNRAHFAKPVEMSPNSGMLQSKLTKT